MQVNKSIQFVSLIQRKMIYKFQTARKTNSDNLSGNKCKMKTKQTTSGSGEGKQSCFQLWPWSKKIYYFPLCSSKSTTIQNIVGVCLLSLFRDTCCLHVMNVAVRLWKADVSNMSIGIKYVTIIVFVTFQPFICSSATVFQVIVNVESFYNRNLKIVETETKSTSLIKYIRLLTYLAW